jgi:U2-associated protein SR140
LALHLIINDKTKQQQEDITTFRNMPDSHDPFPNVKDKLTAPTKKSAFEKSRLEAEAKRLREEAETAAVYKDFVASFDQEPSGVSSSAGSGGARGGFGTLRGGLKGAPPGPGRRHFTGVPSSRGGIGSGLNRKRTIDTAFEREEESGVFGSAGLSDRDKRRLRESNTGLLAFENSAPSGKAKDQFSDDDNSGMQGPSPARLKLRLC